MCFRLAVYNEKFIFFLDIHVIFQKRSRGNSRIEISWWQGEKWALKKQIMSKDKYILQYINIYILQKFRNAREKMFRNRLMFSAGDVFYKEIFHLFRNNHKTLSYLDLNSKRRLIVVDVRFDYWGVSLGWYPRIFLSFSFNQPIRAHCFFQSSKNCISFGQSESINFFMLII